MTSEPSLALAFATIERPQVTQRLIRSVRKYFPELPIYVADQSREIAAMDIFYRSYNINVTRMPYDIGVSASRNQLAQNIKEDYFVLCDDDFIIGEQTSFRDAIYILENFQDLGVIGGRLYDFDGNTESTRNWELFLEYDKKQKILFTIPIYEIAPKVREISGIRFYLCDSVLNFAVFRRSIFLSAARWDDQFKSNGEHEDFYLNLKVNTSFGVAYLPTMVAYHHHPEEYRAYRARLRDRTDGWKRFLKKWDLEQHKEFGLGVRTIDDVETIVDAASARDGFFINANLSSQRSNSAPDTLLIDRAEQISTVGALDKAGNRRDRLQNLGYLLLNSSSGALLAPPNAGDSGAYLESAGTRNEDNVVARYRFDAMQNRDAISVVTKELHFRYDAILLSESDFYLWYFCDVALAGDDRSPRRLSTVARWTASDGTTLVWKSRRTFLDLESANYWRPLHLEVPLIPRGCNWLRFDLVTDGGTSPFPVCTGYLFKARPDRAASSVSETTAGFEVLGLGRIPYDGADPNAAGRLLSDIGRGIGKIPSAWYASPKAGDMSILEIDALTDIEVLYFTDWEIFHRSLIGIRLPRRGLAAPRVIALPGMSTGGQRGRIYGYGGNAGLIELSVPDQVEPIQQ